MKTKEEHTHTARGTDHGSDEARNLDVKHPTADRADIGRLAYVYWEERGCPNDSPDEDWFPGRSRTSPAARCPRIQLRAICNVTKHDTPIHNQPDTPF